VLLILFYLRECKLSYHCGGLFNKGSQIVVDIFFSSSRVYVEQSLDKKFSPI
jgi:hypothetical protein